MWFRNARVPRILLPDTFKGGDDGTLPLCDIEIENDQIRSVQAASTDPGKDLDGALVLPGFCDAHVHLDKAHTWNRAPNPSHTFAQALVTLREDKVHWSALDLERRADFTLRSAHAHGVRAIRTHVDTWGLESETSFATLARLRESWADRLTLQLVSLCGVEQYAGPDGHHFADLPLAYGAAALGGMPLMSPALDAQLDALLTLATERQVGLDLHVDESGDPEAACLRAVAEAVLRHGFPYPVTCGHCCSLAVQPEAEARATLDLVAEAGLQIITLPLCNLYLQDRRLPGEARQTPHWRGLTLIREMLAHGIPLAAASDNVRDAFHAYGDLDSWEVFVQTVRLGHLDTQYGEAIALVTQAAADLMGLPDHGRIGPGARADLVVFPARSWSEALSRPWAPRRLLSGTDWREPALPDYRELEEGAASKRPHR